MGVNENKKTIPQFKEFFIVVYHEPSRDELVKLGTLDYAYIKHDLDFYAEGHEKAGELKKEHYHLYVKLSNKKTINGVGKIFGYTAELSSLYVQSTNGKTGAVRYMTHIDNIEKQPYSIDAIKSNFDISKYFDLQLNFETIILKVLEAVENNEITNFRQLVSWSINNGCVETIAKNSYFFNTLLKK